MSVTRHEHVFLGDVFDSIAVMFSLTQALSPTFFYVLFKKRAAVFYRGLKTRGVAECF